MNNGGETDNSLNNGGDTVDTQTPEIQATSATPGNLFKEPGEKNGENNQNNRDSHTQHEKVRSPVNRFPSWDAGILLKQPVYPTKQKTLEQIKEGADLRPENLENENIEVHHRCTIL